VYAYFFYAFEFAHGTLLFPTFYERF